MYEYQKREQYDEIDEILAVAIAEAAVCIGFALIVFSCNTDGKIIEWLIQIGNIFWARERKNLNHNF